MKIINRTEHIDGRLVEINVWIDGDDAIMILRSDDMDFGYQVDVKTLDGHSLEGLLNMARSYCTKRSFTNVKGKERA